MSDPYYHPQQAYSSTGNAALYAPPENQHQHQPQDAASGYGYEPHPPHQEQGYQHAYSQPQYDAPSTPAVYHPPVPEPQNEYLSPASAIPGADPYGHDETRLSPDYKPRTHQGSTAEY
ncbi:hypothetical protein BJX76DRAFT_305109 [Aspergillus varians]